MNTNDKNKTYFEQLIEILKLIRKPSHIHMIIIGASLMPLGILDIILYAINLTIGKSNTPPPGENIGYREIVGFTLLSIGLLPYFYKWATKRKNDLEEEIVIFLEEYINLSPPRLQFQMGRLFNIIDVDIPSALTVLGHKTNQKRSINLYKHCYLNVVLDNQWFILKNKHYKTWHRIAFIAWITLPLYMVMCAVVLSQKVLIITG